MGSIIIFGRVIGADFARYNIILYRGTARNLIPNKKDTEPVAIERDCSCRIFEKYLWNNNCFQVLDSSSNTGTEDF